MMDTVVAVEVGTTDTKDLLRHFLPSLSLPTTSGIGLWHLVCNYTAYLAHQGLREPISRIFGLVGQDVTVVFWDLHTWRG
jgi:hypothetical protein